MYLPLLIATCFIVVVQAQEEQLPGGNTILNTLWSLFLGVGNLYLKKIELTLAALKIVGNLGVSLVDTVSNVFTGEKPLLPAEPSMAPEQEGSGKEQNNENDDDAGESGDQESSGHGRNLRYVFYD